MSSVVLSNVEMRFGNFCAVRDFSLEVNEAELVTLLGPSGCGKTTVLRMIAGLESPVAGRIELSGRVLSDAESEIHVPPEKRDIGMVFQSYAVWPHMNVARNIDYPLRVQKVGKEERERRLQEILDLVQLTGQENKWPHQLSGGQQQRVALGRGLIRKPKVLLLDEPLSNLDAKLRKTMRVELREIQQSLGMTMLYVTHDREEAEEISDRMAIMNEGRLLQVGSPAEIRERPADGFVKGFFED